MRIQVIEDEQSLQRLYARAIGSWQLPIELRQSLDGYRGLLELGRFEPDLLVLDLNLPNIDGFEVIEAIQSQGMLDQLQLLVVTALDVQPVQARIDAIVPGVEVLPKPIPFDRIQ
ncbi:MAG: response regulator, partial [Gammaproteobacteria bacterium SHHR-1]